MMRAGVNAFALCAVLVLSCGCDLNFGSSGRFIPAPTAPELSSPPVRVARLSYLKGPVSFRPAGSDIWTPAVLNRPLTSGDELWTDAGGGAEVHLGFTAIRLGSKTDFGLLELSDDAFQAKLTEGTTAIRMERLEQGEVFEIDTPNASVAPTGAGEYRIAVTPASNSTDIVVRSGEIEVTNAKQAFEVGAGHRAHVNRSHLMNEIQAAPPLDEFDRFCRRRDSEEEGSESKKYVAGSVIGAYDLDGHGTWGLEPELGSYWTPRVDPGWAPYRFGRWAWIEAWGWTWIDDASWGFAPFHYGRWKRMGNRWCWIPGKPGVPQVFAPALVVFVGRGSARSQFSDRVAKESVAWLPLGPGEVYVPAYQASRQYLMELNAAIVNSPMLDEAAFARQSYANRSVTDAITAVPRQILTSGQPVGSSAIPVDARDAVEMKATGASPALVPRLESLSAWAAHGVRVPEPPTQNSERPVVMRRTPVISPARFELTLPLLEALPGKPLDRQTLDRLSRGIEEERE